MIKIRPVPVYAEPDPDWRLRALCAQVGSDDWFPERGDMQAVARARAVCRRCTVSDECLADALAYEDQYRAVRVGIRAGTTPNERAQLARGEVAA